MIRYDHEVPKALRAVMREALNHGAVDGHHFVLTVETHYPGVKIPKWLKDKYPDVVSFVIQHQYDKLTATDTQISVTLWFNGKPEKLVIPMLAVRMFGDYGADFCMEFEPVPEEYQDVAPPKNKKTVERQSEGNVVQLKRGK